MPNARILIAEDEQTVRQATEAVLKKEGYETLGACDAEQALEILQRSRVDLIITDLNLPGASGIDLLKKARMIYAGTAVIVMTAYGTVQSAVEAMKAGAYDYLTKPIHSYELKALVSRALEHRKLVEEIDLLRDCLRENYQFASIIGASAGLKRTLDVAARVASADVTVLLQGTMGKESEPIAWTREKDGRRVFYTSLGHPDDFKDENFIRLLVNGLAWATKTGLKK